MKAYRPILILVLCLVPNPARKPNNAEQNQPKPSQFSKLATRPLYSDKPAEKASYRSEEAPKWYRTIEWSNWFLVVIGAVTAYAIWSQTKETRRAAEATRDSVKAIERQTDIIERQTKATEAAAEATLQSVTVLAQRERARICVNDVSPLKGSGGTRACEITFQNYGNTPAVLIAQSAWFGIDRWDGEPDKSWPWDDPIRHYESWKSDKNERMGKVVIPGGKHQMRMIGKVPPNIESQGDAEGNCEYSLNLYGFVVYKDVFELGQVETFHETRFCLNYGERTNPSRELWERIGPPEYNRAT